LKSLYKIAIWGEGLQPEKKKNNKCKDPIYWRWVAAVLVLTMLIYFFIKLPAATACLISWQVVICHIYVPARNGKTTGIVILPGWHKGAVASGQHIYPERFSKRYGK